MPSSPKPAARIADARASLFGRLALESGLVTHDQVIECTEIQEQARREGRQPPRLGEVLVRQGYLRERDIENILKMQANPGGLIGRVLREGGVVTREQIQECLEEQADSQRLGLAPLRLGDLLVRKGYASEVDIARALKGRPRQSSLFGKMLIDSGRVTEAQIEECVAEQQALTARGEPAPRLGEMLIRKGVLRREEVELLLRRQTHTFKPKSLSVAAAIPQPMGPRSGIRPGAGFAAMAGFTIHQGLGRNSGGTLYKATHNESGALVTLHVQERSKDNLTPELREGLQHRRRLAMTLRSEHVQRVVAVGDDERVQFYAAEYLEGANLRAVLEQEGKIEWHWAVEIAGQLAAGLAVAGDAGLVHGDLRPGTVFITRAGVCKISMYANVIDPIANLDVFTAATGKPGPYYNAPEQAVPGAVIDIRADLYALGQTLYHALMGRPMHVGRNFVEALGSVNDEAALDALFLNIELPMKLNGIIARLVQRDPDRRYADPRALLADLDALRTDLYADGSADDGGPAAVGVDIAIVEQGTTVGGGVDTSREQAALTLTQFLQTRTARPAPRKIGYGELISNYAGPLFAMALIGLLATLVYIKTNLAYSWEHSARWYEFQNDYERALVSYRAAAEVFPENEALQTRVRDLGYQLGNFVAVEEALLRLKEIHPDRLAEYLQELGNVKSMQRYYRPAAEYYRQALVALPVGSDTATLRYKEAQTLLWMKDFAAAQRAFDGLLDDYPDNTNYLLHAARAAIGAGDMPRAVRLYDQLSRAGGGLDEAQLKEYAWALIESGHKDELRELSRSLLLRQELVERYTAQTRAYLYLWAGQLQDARAAFTRLLLDEPNNVELLRGRIAIADQMNDLHLAMSDYETLHRLFPDDEQTTLTLARLQQSQQQFKAAEELFKSILAKRPKDVELLRDLGMNAAYDSRYGDAIAFLRQAAELAPSDTTLVQSLADVHLWNEDYDGALPYLTDLLRRNPNDLNARLGLLEANGFSLKRDPAAAGRGIEIARRLIGEDLTPEQRIRFVNSLLKYDDNEILVQALEADRSGDPALADALVLVAKRFRAAEQHARAVDFYLRAVKIRPDDIGLLLEAAETASWAKKTDVSMDLYKAAGHLTGLPPDAFVFEADPETPADDSAVQALGVVGTRSAKRPASGAPAPRRQVDGLSVPDAWIKPQFREMPPELSNILTHRDETPVATPQVARTPSGMAGGGLVSLPPPPPPAATGEMPPELRAVDAGAQARPQHPALVDPLPGTVTPPILWGEPPLRPVTPPAPVAPVAPVVPGTSYAPVTIATPRAPVAVGTVTTVTPTGLP